MISTRARSGIKKGLLILASVSKPSRPPPDCDATPHADDSFGNGPYAHEEKRQPEYRCDATRSGADHAFSQKMSHLRLPSLISVRESVSLCVRIKS
jgi:hypothetical protein